MADDKHKGVSQAELVAAADDVSKVMDLEVAIPAEGRKAKQIATDIKTEVDYVDPETKEYDGIKSDDKLEDATWDVLKKIGAGKKATSTRDALTNTPASAADAPVDKKAAAKAKKAKVAAAKKAATTAKKANSAATPATPHAANREKDAFGFTVGSHQNKFIVSLKKKAKTMQEIREEKWNEKGSAHYNAWKIVKALGKGKYDDKTKKMSIIK